MTRILQVVTDTDRRGAQVFALDLHDAFTRCDQDVRTVALAPGQVGGLQLPTLGARRLSPQSLLGLRREIDTASVVIAHGSSTLLASAISTFGNHRPFIYRQISDSLFWASSRTRRARVKWGLSHSAHVVALWDGSAQTLMESFGVGPHKLSVIPNAVPARKFSPVSVANRPPYRARFGLAPDRDTLLCVSALAEEKGIDLAIDVVAQLPTAQLLIVGDGPERSSLEARARAVAEGRVVFTGAVRDPRPAYGAADLFLFPTRGGDSMPAALIEAGMMGLPAVAAPIGAIPQIVLDKATGLIAPRGSSSAFIEAARVLIDRRVVAESFGRAARRHCLASFDIDVVASRWLDVLSAVSRP
jgi:glycosyltransferase involved in cell wall biosynthesis